MTLSQPRHKNIVVCQGGFATAAAAVTGFFYAAHQKGVKIDRIAATSGGSTASLLFSIGKSPEEVEEMLSPQNTRRFLMQFNLPKLWAPLAPITEGPLRLDKLERYLEEQLPPNVRTFADLINFCNQNNLPQLRVTSTLQDAILVHGPGQIESGRGYQIIFGDQFTQNFLITEGIRASCTVPGLITPLDIDTCKRKLGTDKITLTFLEGGRKAKKRRASPHGSDSHEVIIEEKGVRRGIFQDGGIRQNVPILPSLIEGRIKGKVIYEGDTVERECYYPTYGSPNTTTIYIIYLGHKRDVKTEGPENLNLGQKFVNSIKEHFRRLVVRNPLMLAVNATMLGIDDQYVSDIQHFGHIYNIIEIPVIDDRLENRSFWDVDLAPVAIEVAYNASMRLIEQQQTSG